MSAEKADNASVSSEGSLEGKDRYGCLSWRPSGLQCFNKAKWFVVFACVSSYAHTMGLTLTSVTTSTLETRYGFSSTQMGLVMSIYEISGVFVLIVIGMIANYVDRPRWLSWGMVSVCIACILYTVPQYISPLYEYDLTTVDTEHWCVVNATDHCATHVESNNGYALAFFYTSAIFFALGSVPMYMYTISYIDDSNHYTRGALYTSLFISMACFGPVTAFVVGGGMLYVWVDFARMDEDTVTIDPEDPRWVGAWWVAFLAASLVALVDVLPLLGFPKNPPYRRFDADVIKDKIAVETQKSVVSDATDVREDADMLATAHLTIQDTIKTMPKYMKQLYTNGSYVFTTLGGISDGFLITGFTAFGPKYIETMFNLTPGAAGAAFGLTVLPGATCGTIMAGWLIRKRRLSPVSMLKTIFICNLVIMLFGFIFLLRCDAQDFYGVSVNVHPTQEVLTCAEGYACNCSRNVYDPVCGADGVTYFSSCHAGCLTADLVAGTYGNCSCVGGGMYPNSTVTLGLCSTPECHQLAPFLVLFLVPQFFLFIGLQMHTQAVLRIVNLEHRTLALSLDWVVVRLFGTVPGPLVFAALLDLSCLLWDIQCSGDTGECLYYDNRQMGLYMLACCAVAKGPACICSAVSWFLYHRKLRKNQNQGIKRAITINDFEVSVPAADVPVTDSSTKQNGQPVIMFYDDSNITRNGTAHDLSSHAVNGGFVAGDDVSYL